MTKMAARAVAKRAQRYGYHSHPASPDYPSGRLEVTCPLCREKVCTSRNYREFPARKGQPANIRADGSRYIFRQETVAEAIDRAMMTHLLDGWCES